LAFGDVNGDGHLDLVSGHSGRPDAVYLNLGGVFADSSLYAGPVDSTYSTAWGDIDGDGYVDLVCGNRDSNTLYLNQGGVIDTTPAWSSLPRNSTRSVVLADINGDEDLDLVCGNSGQSNTLYLNTGPPDYFSTGDADWFSRPENYTQSIAVGDVNGDGNPDLLCGNSGQKNTLYLGDGNVFSEHADWDATDSRATQSVALSDLDGNGYPDLIFANNGQKNTIYSNDWPNLLLIWESQEENPTYAVALGDVNGDGHPDLVFGNSGLGVTGANKVYLSDAGQFQDTTPYSMAEGSLTLALALRDVDGNGTLDLISGTGNQANTVHLNKNGLLLEPPVWSSPIDDVTTRSVSLADVDLDGDLDLFCGNYIETNSYYPGIRNPVYKGDPTDPTHQLTNNSAFLRAVRVQPLGNNQYRIQVTGVDVESDPIWIRPTFQYEGDPNWISPNIVGYGETVGPLETSPAGEIHQFDWDASFLSVDPRNVTLQLQVISHPQTTGLIQHVASFHRNIGPLDIRRAQIMTSVSELPFPAVTLGDTVPGGFDVSNLGNDVLRVSNIELPWPEMIIVGSDSFAVMPGEVHRVEFLLAPRVELEPSGDLLIHSNDPASPTTIPVTTDTRPLTVTTQALTETTLAPLGDAITLLVNPHEGVNIERGALHHRPLGAGLPFAAMELTSTGGSLIAVIPGEAVTEAGLEYYIELENSGVFATDPADTSQGNYYRQLVQAPDCFGTQPQPTSGPDYLEGRSVPVLLDLGEGVIFVQGSLFYRRGGETVFAELPIQDADPLPVAIIPDSLVGPRGIEYWVQVQTGTTTLTDPCRDPQLAPHLIRVRVPDLVEPTPFPARTYRMISVPLDFGVDFTGTLEALLSDQDAFGPYHRPRWRSFCCYDPGTGEYLEHSDQNAAAFRPVPGRAFWLICASEHRIDTAPVAGHSVPTDSAYAIVLEPGFNQIGNPFAFPVAWDSVLVETTAGMLTMAQAEPADVESLTTHQGDSYTQAVRTMPPFGGHWVKNNSSEPIVLHIPAREAPPGGLALKEPAAATGPPEWRLIITASCGDAMDRRNVIGVHADAAADWDRYDRPEPPPIPGRSLSLYFPHSDWRQLPGPYTVDFRPPATSDAGHTWPFDLGKSFADNGPSDEVQLTFTGLDHLPADLTALLLDRHLLHQVDLRTEGRYRFHCGRREFSRGEESSRFLLLVGSEEFVSSQLEELPGLPARTALLPNRPNPFNPATVIRYDVAQAGPVSLRIYNVSGALVRNLLAEHLAPGRYEAVWRGDDDRGRQVAAGVYFCRLEASGNFKQTRKMLLIK
jgi:hypothetical protein